MVSVMLIAIVKNIQKKKPSLPTKNLFLLYVIPSNKVQISLLHNNIKKTKTQVVICYEKTKHNKNVL